MPTPWEDSVRTRTPKELTIFVSPTINKVWRKAFDDALAEFQKLSVAHSLGVTMAIPNNATAPDPDSEAGADIQFAMGKGDISYKAFGEDVLVKGFSGTSMHGLTQIVKRRFGTQPARIRRAFIFVPETPMINAAMKVGREFRHIPREAGAGIKMFIALHELIHACGLDNSDHTASGPDADILIGFPQPSAGPFDKPDQDKLLLHLAHPQPNVFAPPVFMKKATADKIRDNWA